MLDLIGPQSTRFCDGVTRRSFLRVGGLSALGLSLSDLFRLRQARAKSKASAAGATPTSSAGNRGKSVILIWMDGGPSQLETLDPKPEAPSEYRGPYGSMPTIHPGVHISDSLPLHAKILDKVTIHRALSHDNGNHFESAHWLLTGHKGATEGNPTPQNPSMGALTARFVGARDPNMLPYVNMNMGGFGFHGAAYLGVAYNPFQLGSDGNKQGKRMASPDRSSFSLADGMTVRRLERRRSLLQDLDTLNREVDAKGLLDGMDALDRQAFDIILSGKARKAFDLTEENERTRELYGPGWGEQALLARRLVEAGTTFVTINTGDWDTHGKMMKKLTRNQPVHDRMVHALITDLDERGMLDDTLVVVAGEFGRTPKINSGYGRDHWPQAQSILIAGGGYRHGQVVGATNERAEFPTDSPMTPADFNMMFYHVLGIDPLGTTLRPDGRPIHILPGGHVPEQLL